MFQPAERNFHLVSEAPAGLKARIQTSRCDKLNTSLKLLIPFYNINIRVRVFFSFPVCVCVSCVVCVQCFKVHPGGKSTHLSRLHSRWYWSGGGIHSGEDLPVWPEELQRPHQDHRGTQNLRHLPAFPEQHQQTQGTCGHEQHSLNNHDHHVIHEGKSHDRQLTLLHLHLCPCPHNPAFTHDAVESNISVVGRLRWASVCVCLTWCNLSQFAVIALYYKLNSWNLKSMTSCSTCSHLSFSRPVNWAPPRLPQARRDPQPSCWTANQTTPRVWASPPTDRWQVQVGSWEEDSRSVWWWRSHQVHN